MGNLVNQNMTPSGHLVRSGYCNTCIYSHNEIGPNSTGLRLTVRAFEPFAGGDNTFPPNTAWTEKVIISGNRILDSGTTVRTVNNFNDGRLRNIIVESNELLAVSSTGALLATEAGEITIRNNLLGLTGASVFNAIVLAKSTGTPVGVNNNISILNNSAYAQGTGGSDYNLVLVFPNAAPDNLRVQNNLSYLPGSTGGTLNAVNPLSPLGVNPVISNNTTGAAIRTCNPGFAADPPVLTTHWQPSSVTCAVDIGTPVPVWVDFFGSPRTGTYDFGAVNP
jgi:hypothetical protein